MYLGVCAADYPDWGVQPSPDNCIQSYPTCWLTTMGTRSWQGSGRDFNFPRYISQTPTRLHQPVSCVWAKCEQCGDQMRAALSRGATCWAALTLDTASRYSRYLDIYWGRTDANTGQRFLSGSELVISAIYCSSHQLSNRLTFTTPPLNFYTAEETERKLGCLVSIVRAIKTNR